MLNIFSKSALIIIFLSGLNACKKSEPSGFPEPTRTNPEDAFAENYKFYPLNSTNVWNYTHYEISPYPTDTLKRDLITKHDVTTGRTTTLFGTDTFSYQWWGNRDNKMKLGDFIVIDYSLLDSCQGDSVLIFQDAFPTGLIRRRYQHCGLTNSPTPVAAYQNTDCIKTELINTYSDGRVSIFTYYFAKNIGIVSIIDRIYNSSGVLIRKSERHLTSTNF